VHPGGRIRDLARGGRAGVARWHARPVTRRRGAVPARRRGVL